MIPTDPRNKLTWVILSILTILLVAIASYPLTLEELQVREYYDIYRATVPFGEFMISGTVHGFLFIGTGSITGTISGEEYYLVKYFDSPVTWRTGVRVLKTISLDATETPLVIDGTLRLEEIHTVYSARILFLFKIKYYGQIYPDYKLHIPYLPLVNQTMRDNWSSR